MKLTFSTLDVLSVVTELREKIIGFRISNIYDLNNKTYLLKLVSNSTEEKLVLLLESGSRIHLTNFEWPKNVMPSGFSMKLRKHIRNKKISTIKQLGIDRIVDIEIGFEYKYHLIIELYDRGNMFLADHAYTILHLLRPRTDANQNIRYATRETFPVDSVRPVPQCLRNINDESTVDKIKSHTLPLLEKCRGPWNKQAPLLPTINKVLNSEFTYGNVTIEHCIHVTQCRVRKLHQQPETVYAESELKEQFAHIFAMALRDLVVKVGTPTLLPRGYIFLKNQSSENEHLEVYEDYQPYLFAQFTNRNHLTYSSFNETVDTYFSSVESRRTAEQLIQNERKANRKLENIKTDHEKRLQALKDEQELDIQKAQFLESNQKLVDSIILMLNHALCNQLDWSELESMIADAKLREDPVARPIMQLHLESNQALIRLSDPYAMAGVSENATDDVALCNAEKENAQSCMDILIDLDLNASNNARKYYDKRRAAIQKEAKTLLAANKALKSATHKAEMTRKGAKTIMQISEVRKAMWFEKFHWFISSENYLVIAGRDSQQNELLVKRYLKSGDIFVHADVHGASCVIVKARHSQPEEMFLSSDNSDVKCSKMVSLHTPPPKTLLEAANMAVVLSVAWSSHVLTSAWWVRDTQVSKTAPTGEYLTTGAFIIRGRKNYLPPSQLDYGFAILFKLHEDSIVKHRGERKIVTNCTDEYHSPNSSNQDLVLDKRHENDICEFPNAFLQLDLNKNGDRCNQSYSQLTNEITFLQSSSPAMNTGQKITHKNQSKSKKLSDALASDKSHPNNNKESSPKFNLDTNITSQNNDRISLKRGQKFKLKKIRQKYSIQDEDERQLRMQILQGDGAKASKFHLLLDQGSTNASFKTAIESDCRTNVINEQDVDSDSIESDDDHTSNMNSDTQDEVNVIGDQPPPSSDEEVDVELDTNKLDELLDPLDSLTGQPNEDDLLLYALPICAPYSTLLKYKYKVKLNPGTTKRGKACKAITHHFSLDKSATTRERDLLKALKDEDLVRNFPGTVKVILPQGRKNGRKSKMNHLNSR